jgi:glycosyltransferase involved in cell wall biosynthesis
MQDTTVFCLPSFGEPYANTIIEAMSCGKPIVATDSGGIPALVPPAGGILVPPGDATALSAALERVLRSEELQAQMGATNRKYVEEKLTWTAVVGRLEAIYSSLLGTPGQQYQRLVPRREWAQ